MPMTPKVLIVDVESTCWEGSVLPDGRRQGVENMEIIELGCVMCDRSGQLLDSASFLVKPVDHPSLSDFCQSLTGISQQTISEATPFKDTIQRLNDWIGVQNSSFIWASWGNYDRLHLEADSSKRNATPELLRYDHLNLRKLWRLTTKQRKKNSLRDALNYHAFSFDGHQHSGLDDAKNTAKLLSCVDWTRADEALTRAGE
jgi:inhibitor of KinA sporulation pathway (predicted exonuclease)